MTVNLEIDEDDAECGHEWLGEEWAPHQDDLALQWSAYLRRKGEWTPGLEAAFGELVDD